LVILTRGDRKVAPTDRMLHILNGDSTRMSLERSGVPGTLVVWPDILYEGPTPLVLGDDWIRVRTAYLATGDHGGADEILENYRRRDAALEGYAAHEEVVFWFEHDLFDQLLLIRHLWWMDVRLRETASASRAHATRFSLVCRDRYLGLLKPEEFPALFERRRAITGPQRRAGAAAWEVFCGPDPERLVPLAEAPSADLPFLPGALWRHLEEYPSVENGLARSEAQILRILSDGSRSPEDTFHALTRTEERVFMGDTSFWTIIRRLAAGPHPLVVFDVAERPGRLPTGRVGITDEGRGVLSGRADYVALNGIDRWLGGVHLTPAGLWRWTGASVRPATA